MIIVCKRATSRWFFSIFNIVRCTLVAGKAGSEVKLSTYQYFTTLIKKFVYYLVIYWSLVNLLYVDIQFSKFIYKINIFIFDYVLVTII
jgi:ammonia channel protein AmtB